MKTELKTVAQITEAPESFKTELLISQQKNEIMELRLKNNKLHAEKASRLDDSLFSPRHYDHYKEVAAVFAASDMIPKSYKGKPGDVFVAMAMGYQLGFPVEQSLQDIAVISGRPCLWGDGLLSLALSHDDCRGIKEEPIHKDDNIIGYRCTVKRVGHDPHIQEFTLDDAKRAGLLSRGAVWGSYPTRMLQMRARSLAIRDKFADALRGLKVGEIEKEDAKIIEGEVVSEAIELPTQTQKLKKILIEKSLAREEETEVESKGTTNDASGKITDDTFNKLHALINEKTITSEKLDKALTYFKVEKLEDLTEDQAKIFLIKTGK